jgi:hypothetical protein
MLNKLFEEQMSTAFAELYNAELFNTKFYYFLFEYAQYIVSKKDFTDFLIN